MKNLFYILTISILAFTACKKEKETTNGVEGPQQIQLHSYPLTIGNSWKYYTESHITDSNGVNSLSSYYDNFWTVISDTTINGIVSSKVAQLDSNYNGTTHLGYTYYANRPDGFYGMAEYNQGSLFFLRPDQFIAQIQFSLIGSFGSSLLSTDSIIVPDTSLRFLKFPSNTNDIWLSYEYNNPVPDVIKRKYLGNSTLTTSAGTFDCVKLQMFWDYDHNNQPDSGTSEIYQYFSTKGLIQEEWNEAITFGSGIDSLHRITKLVHANF